MLRLVDAIKTGKIKEFAEQEQRRGIGPVSDTKFDAALKEIATKPPLPKLKRKRAKR